MLMWEAAMQRLLDNEADHLWLLQMGERKSFWELLGSWCKDILGDEALLLRAHVARRMSLTTVRMFALVEILGGKPALPRAHANIEQTWCISRWGH